MNSDSITLDKHFIERIRERMMDDTMSEDDMRDYVHDAITYGLKICDVMNRRYKQYLLGILKKYKYSSDIRILDGFVYVFDAFTATAITVYRVPYWATYERNYGC